MIPILEQLKKRHAPPVPRLHNVTPAGYAPIVQQISEVATGEMLGLAGGLAVNSPGDSGITIHCQASLKSRKIYAWSFVLPTTFDTPGGASNDQCGFNSYWFSGTIYFRLNHTLVGTLPIGNYSAFQILFTTPALYNPPPPVNVTTGGKSLYGLAGVNSSDPLVIYPLNPQSIKSLDKTGTQQGIITQPSNVLLSPQYFTGAFDEVTCSVDVTLQCFDIRIFLAVISNP